MFSLIITIISIALVAALALATLYYGGDAFNKGRAGADASKLINEGQQINGAVALAKADNAVRGTIADLQAGQYLASVPSSFLATTPTVTSAQTAATVSAEVCIEVNKRATGLTAPATPVDLAGVTTVYGCFGPAGTGADKTFVFKM